MENDTAKSGGTNDVADAFQALLANEELMQSIRSLFAQPTSEAPRQEATEAASAAPPDANTETEEEPATQQGEVLPPVTDLRELLNNPAVTEKLPQIMAMLGPMMQHGKEEPPRSETETGAKKLNTQSRESLLRALKPFLSPGRQTAVDSIVRLSQLGQILQQLK